MRDDFASSKVGRRDIPDFLIATSVFVISLLGYLGTVQPTIPYWDCGEFIASAATLSVPHPPGSPLFVLLGRLAAMLPLGGEIAWRINLISAFSSAFTALLGYRIIVWVVRRWSGDAGNGARRLLGYLAGLVGALTMAFSRTFWSNAVEAEVYGVSMLIMLLSVWLLFKWLDHRNDRRGEQYLIMFAYLSVLALGFHLTSFIVVPFACLLILAADEEYRRSPALWVAFAITVVLAFEVSPYIVLASAWSTVGAVVYFWERIRTGWVYTLAVPCLVSITLIASGYSFVPVFAVSFFAWNLVTLLICGLTPVLKAWRLSFLITMSGLLGLSVQLYTPIRSARNPVIDMNHPVTWEKVSYFLERKQYGSQDMITRMFNRRGEWVNQFGTHPRLGFWGFFREQYSRPRLFLLLFAIGLLGMFMSIRRRWKVGAFLLLICLATTVGLVLYMNFADGTRASPLTGEGQLEVRDRDYFFTPGFMLFGLCIGLGVAALGYMLLAWVEKLGARGPLRPAVPAVLCIALLIPAAAYAHNHFQNDRSRNHLAYDYARNLLSSCRPNSILFTNGDNDTFPVWCLQYAYLYRPDVRALVLSLLQGDWYVQKQKHEFGVPVSWSDETISRLQPEFYRDSVYLVSNQVVDNIIDNTLVKSTRPAAWPELPLKFSEFQKLDSLRRLSDTTLYFEPPLQFATTVDTKGLRYKKQPIPNARVGAMLEGIVYTLVPFRTAEGVNVSRTVDYFDHVFSDRGLRDTLVYKDDNAFRLAENYWRVLARTADVVFVKGDGDEALRLNRKAVAIAIDPAEAFKSLVKNLKYADRLSDLEELIRTTRGASDQRLREAVVFTLDLMAAADYNRVLRTAQSQGLALSEAAPKAAEVMLANPQYAYYLRFLDDFVGRYPNDPQGKGSVGKQMQSVLKDLPAAQISRLDFKFMQSGGAQAATGPGK